MDGHFSGDGVGSDFAPHATDQDLVVPRKGSRGDIPFPVRRVVSVGGCVIIPHERAPRGRPRRRQRTDCSGRLLHDHVDVGVAGPGEVDDDVANKRCIDGGPEGDRIDLTAALLKRLDRRLGEPARSGHNLLLASRPFMREHAGAGPKEGRGVVRAGGHRHRECEGLAIGRIDPGHLPADPNRLLVGAESGEIVAELEQLDRPRCEVGGREQRPLDILAGLSCGLHRDGQRFIHPRLAMAAGNRGRDQFHSLVKPAFAAEFGGRHPEPRQPHRGGPFVGRSGLRFSGRLPGGQVGLERRTKICGVQHGVWQSDPLHHRGIRSRLLDAGRGGRRHDRAGSEPRASP